MKRRAFLTMLGLSPVAAISAPAESTSGLKWMDGSPATLEEFDALFATPNYGTIGRAYIIKDSGEVARPQIVMLNNRVVLLDDDGIEWQG